MTDLDRLVGRIPKAIVVAIVGTITALGVAYAALYQAQHEQQERCEAGNSFRADVRELAGTTASGFTELANIIVGDEPRTPEEQERIDAARDEYDLRVVGPLSALADSAGSLAPRSC